MGTLAVLPTELLRNIVHLLPTKDVRCVSVSLRALFDGCNKKLTLDVEKLGFSAAPHRAATLFKRSPQLVELKIRGLNEDDPLSRHAVLRYSGDLLGLVVFLRVPHKCLPCVR